MGSFPETYVTRKDDYYDNYEIISVVIIMNHQKTGLEIPAKLKERYM